MHLSGLSYILLFETLVYCQGTFCEVLTCLVYSEVCDCCFWVLNVSM